MSVRTVDVRPGDYLPPQACLDPTDWQDSGFPVGPAPGDVCLDYPRPGRVLLFGELGIMDSLTKHLVVTVIRPDTGAAPPA